MFHIPVGSRDNLASIAIQSWCEQDFPARRDRPQCPPSLLCSTVVTGSLLGVKWSGRGVDHPPSSATEVANSFEAITKCVAESVLVEFIFCCYSDDSRAVVVTVVVAVVLVEVVVIVV